MNDDIDLEQAASMLVQQHGDRAARYAAQWATALLEAGNDCEAERFARIARTIHGMMQTRDQMRLSHRQRESGRRARAS